MPYKVAKHNDKFCVEKDDGSAVSGGCHDAKEDAENHMKALYANVSDATKARCLFVPVRSLAQPHEIQGYLMVWGDPQHRDCYDTYASRADPPELNLQFTPFPLNYSHGFDPKGQIGKEPVGTVTEVLPPDSVGIPYKAVLDTNHPYYSRIADEVRRGELGTSTGVPDYLAEFAPDGRFVRWPVAEVSLTDQPCEYRMPAVKATDKRAFRSAARYEPSRASSQGNLSDCDCEHEEPKRALPVRSKHIEGNTRMNKKKTRVTTTTAATAEPPVNTMGGEATLADDGADASGGNLTISELGLSDSATLADIYDALCAKLGDNAASAHFEDAMGDDGSMDGEDDPNGLDLSDMERSNRGTDASFTEGPTYEDDEEDPEEDTMPEDFMGTTEPDDISKRNRKTGANTTTKALARTISQQRNGLQPRSQPMNRMQKLEQENRQLRRSLRDAPMRENANQRNGYDRRGGTGINYPFRTMDLKYDGCSASDLAFAMKALDSAGSPISDDLYRAATYKIAAEVERNKEWTAGGDATVRYVFPFRDRSDVMSASISGVRSRIGPLNERLPGNRRPYRAGEVMGATNVGFGSNYIGVFYDTDLWLKIRAMPIWEQLLARGMEEKIIPIGYASDVIPLEGADFTWYRVPETVDVDATGRPKINISPSKAGTNSTTLTVRTLGALVYYSVLLEEDSIVPAASELNRKANVQSAEQIEYVILNGDTATGTGNLNLKNGTVASSDVFNYTVADGMLKYAIYGNSGLNARQSGALSDLDYQLLFALLGVNGIAGSDPNKLMFVVDPQAGLATDRLPIVKTADINSAATVEKGKVTEMYGVPIYRSGQISSADSTGYIDSVTAANNKYGRLLCVRPDQWVLGMKRNWVFEFFRDVPGQSNGMVITSRFGLQSRDSQSAASVTYSVVIK